MQSTLLDSTIMDQQSYKNATVNIGYPPDYKSSVVLLVDETPPVVDKMLMIR